MRRDVAARARIRVLVPDAPEPLAPFEDGDVVVAGPAKHGGGSDSAEAAADDRERSV
jgi:hypothetical protein